MQLGTSSFHGQQLRCPQQTTTRVSSCWMPVRAMKDVQGKVVSTSMQKTAVIQVDRYVPHRIYGKRVRRTKKFFAHDEEEKCDVGDVVEIEAVAPISKNKAFRVARIVAKSDF